MVLGRQVWDLIQAAATEKMVEKVSSWLKDCSGKAGKWMGQMNSFFNHVMIYGFMFQRSIAASTY